MAKADLIPPFPPEIDRDAFGHYLAGLTDGEGCFFLGIIDDKRNPRRSHTPIVQFVIQLRADDLLILQLVRSYLQCGHVTEVKRKKTEGNRKPKVCYNVANYLDLATVVVPHFDRFPLRAKKARDFVIWRQAVLLCHRVMPGRGRGAGGARRWPVMALAEFGSLRDALRKQREFAAPMIEPSLPAQTVRGLFDDLQG